MSNKTMFANIAATFILSISYSSGAIAPIRDYQPHNDVSPFLAISEDLRAMDNSLKSETEDGFKEALQIYELGAYSDPFTPISVSDGLPFDIPKGTTLTGTDNDGGPVTVTVAFRSYKAGENSIDIAFRSDPPCRMSGIPVPELDGCLITDGELVAEGSSEKIRYTYRLDDIQNYHTIQRFSKNAISKFRPHGNNHARYYPDFDHLVYFFGSPDFADRIITAAFNRDKYVGEHITLDFSEFGHRALRSIIVHTAAFLTIRPFIIREMETSLVNCDDRCGISNCNKDSIHALDGAVALYTGSVFEETGKGNLMYGLAEDMCEEFRTCGQEGVDSKGTAKINLEIFREFNEMQKNLDSSHCVEARLNKRNITKLMSIPLLQATLLAAYIDQNTNTLKSRSDRIVFTTTILSMVYECDSVASVPIIEQTNPNEAIPDDGFDLTKTMLEAKYGCMDVSCQDIGGIWDSNEGDYMKGAESCYLEEEEPTDESSSKLMHFFFMSLLAMAALGLVGFCVLKRNLRRQRNFPDGKHYDDDDSDDSDDESVELRNTLT